MTEQEKLESLARGKALAAKLRGERKTSSQAKRCAKRSDKVVTLKDMNNPDARKELKKLQDQYHGRRYPSAGDWFNPSGKRRVSHK